MFSTSDVSTEYWPPRLAWCVISWDDDRDRLLAAEALTAVSEADRRELQGLPLRLHFAQGALELQGAAGEVLRADLVPSSGRPPLLRATLAGRSPRPVIADATAGLGGDTFDLAAAGCTVVAIGQALVPWLRLQDALRRALADPARAGAASRISLLRGNATEVLAAEGPFDVVYLDPLFQGGKTSAGKRKSMRLLHELASGVTPESELLAVASQAAFTRVTVKRPQAGPYLAGVRPSGSLEGRTVRFDLYSGLAEPAD